MRSGLANGRALAIIFLSGQCLAVHADGILVVGITKDPGKDGFVYSYKVNSKIGADARQEALDDCRNAKIENTANARKACKVISEFANKCFAFAFDPKIGTPGVGWSIAASKAQAEEQAIDKCRDQSSSERATFCAVEKSACDGDAN